MYAKIEGLPSWVKIKQIGKITPGDWYLDRMDGGIKLALGHHTSNYDVIVESDNVYGSCTLAQYPIPEGWERVDGDWFRLPIKGDFFISMVHVLGVQLCVVNSFVASSTDNNKRIIVRKKKKLQRYLILKYPVSNEAAVGNYSYGFDFKIRGKRPVLSEVIEVEE